LQHELNVAALVYGIQIPYETRRELYYHVPERRVRKMLSYDSGAIGISLSDKSGGEIGMSSCLMSGELSRNRAKSEFVEFRGLT
jgi:hypothetical protein